MVDGTCHTAGMIDHLVYADGQCIGVACHDVRGRVAYQYAVDSCGIDNACGSKIVSGKHSNFLASLLHFSKGLGGDFLLVSR